MSDTLEPHTEARVSFARFRILAIGMAALGFLSWTNALAFHMKGVVQIAEFWALNMLGPLGSIYLDRGTAAGSLTIGWLLVMMIAAHPLRPSTTTAVITIIGCSLWWFLGFTLMTYCCA